MRRSGTLIPVLAASSVESGQKSFWSLDLELNNPEGAPRDFKPKIIQVGISVGLWPSCSIIYTSSRYIKIDEPVHENITRLTGITDEILQNEGKTHREIFDWLKEVKEEYKITLNNPVQWGGGDARELIEELEQNTKEPCYLFGRREIDVKTIFTFKEIVRGRSIKLGLKSAMNRYGIEFLGTPHRADDDAYNAMRFFFHILKSEEIINYHIDSLYWTLNHKY